MGPDDIHKTSANSGPIILPVTEPEPLKVILDPSTPSVTSIARVVIVALVMVFIAGFLASIISSLTFLFFLLVLSVFFAYLISPLVRIIRKPFKGGKFDKLMPRPLAIIISYAVVFTVLGFGISSLAPVVSRQSADFAANLPAVASRISESFTEINRRFDRLRVPEDVQARITGQAVGLGERLTAFFGNLLLSLVIYLPWLLLVPILAFFFLKDVESVRLTVLRIFPAGPWRFRADAVLEDVNTTLAAYARAQIISCLLIGTICTIGFWAIGLNYAVLLGILAGVFEFVPLLGPAAIGILVTTTAGFSARPWNALYVFIFLVVLRVVHDYFTYPRIVRGGLHLHPLLIIISVLAGEQVAGIPGVFLAIPIVAILTVLYKHVLEHRQSTGMVKELLDTPAPAEDERPLTADRPVGTL